MGWSISKPSDITKKSVFTPYPIVTSIGQKVTYLDLIEFGQLTDFGIVSNNNSINNNDSEKWNKFFNIINVNLNDLNNKLTTLANNVENYDPPEILLSKSNNTISISSNTIGYNTRLNQNKNSIIWQSLDNENITITPSSNKLSATFSLSSSIQNNNEFGGNFNLSFSSSNNVIEKEVTKSFTNNEYSYTNSDLYITWTPNTRNVTSNIICKCNGYKTGITKVSANCVAQRPTSINLCFRINNGNIENKIINLNTDVQSEGNNKWRYVNALRNLSTNTNINDINNINDIFVDEYSYKSIERNMCSIKIKDTTKYYWYIGTTAPSSSITVTGETASNDGTGWRLLGKSYYEILNGAYTNDVPVWDGATNSITLSNTRTTAYIALPAGPNGSSEIIKIRDTDSDELNSIWIKQSNITVNGKSYNLYKATNIKIFNGTIY